MTRALQNDSSSSNGFRTIPRNVTWAPGYVCGSQLFSFELAKEMARKEGVQVIGMRSREHWVQVHPSFAAIPFLANKQSPWLTRRNMDEQIYNRVLDALRK